MLDMLKIACAVARNGNKHRKAWVGSCGVRRDGALVTSWNGSAAGTTVDRNPTVHAERRLVRKLDTGSVVYVGRVRRDDGSIAMAKPCPRCEASLKNRGVKRCYYTISPTEYGCIEF